MESSGNVERGRVADMIGFRSISDFPKGTLYRQLVDAYSFDARCREAWDAMWREYDDFFCANPDIAEKYGFVTTVDGAPIGHITWDPRNRPECVEIGHNCILTAYKGRGYGGAQLREALRRIREYGVRKIVVTTNEILLPAQRNYESAGFVKVAERPNLDAPFTGNYMDYEMVLEH